MRIVQLSENPVDRDEDHWQLLRDGTFLPCENDRSALNAMYSMVEDHEIQDESDEPEYLIIHRLRRAPKKARGNATLSPGAVSSRLSTPHEEPKPGPEKP